MATASTRREKQAVVGRALAPGHPAFGRFIGQPVAGHRNPVSYIRDPEGADHAERRAFHYIYIYIYMNLAPVLCPGETNHEVEALVKAALRLTPGIRQPATGRSPRRGASCA